MAQALTLDGINLSDVEEFWTAPIEQRAAAFALLRSQPGLPFYEQPDFPYLPPGLGYYALTRLDDVREVSRHAEVFLSAPGATGLIDTPQEFNEFYGSMINMDDPRHARLRRIVSRGFTPRRMGQMQDQVARIAAEIVDDVIDRGACDAVADIATRLPLRLICDLMGVPASQHAFVFERTNRILGPLDPEYLPEGSDILAALLQAGYELAELMKELGRERAKHPTDDLTSVLVSAEIDGERLTDEELGSFFILLVVAGNETTRNAISWGIKALTDYPEQRAIWATDFEGIAPTAVEEIVRWASPVILMRRTLSQPYELSGQRLEAGEKVAMFYWSANRDERHFTDPEAFDVRRSPNPHVGYGAQGPHYCLGAHLARLEITGMFRELFARLPGLHATGEPRRLKSFFINGVKSLPCAF